MKKSQILDQSFKVDLGDPSVVLVGCSTGCSDLKNLSSNIGNSLDCRTRDPKTNQLICQPTVFGKINDFVDNKIGINDNLTGNDTLFHLINKIDESLGSTVTSLGDQTIFGKVTGVQTSTNLIGTINDSEKTPSLFGQIAGLKSSLSSDNKEIKNTVLEIKADVDSIGLSSDDSSDGTLFGHINHVDSNIGNSLDCRTRDPETNQLICQPTVFGKINDFVDNKIGINDNLTGNDTLFHLINKIDESLGSTVTSFGDQTIFGKVIDIHSNCGNNGGSGGNNMISLCSIKASSRIAGAMHPFVINGSGNSGYFADPLTGAKIPGSDFSDLTATKYPDALKIVYEYLISQTNFC